eukprot:scaffold7566_cov1129-Prasinococcus_capsulatus_cf.AAC.1
MGGEWARVCGQNGALSLGLMIGAKPSRWAEREGRHGSSRTCGERHPPWGAVRPAGAAPLPPGVPGGVPPGRGGRPHGPPV